MKRIHTVALACLVISLAVVSSARAHIKMLKPAPWINEDGVGGPQKGGPCGPGSTDPIFGDDVQPVPTNGKVTTFTAGQKITVEWSEEVGHPGWFRIALAENRADLKDPDIEYDFLCNVDHDAIPTSPHGNVLADGIFIASSATARPNAPNLKYEVTLPNKPCEKCTLQLLQFMEVHPPGCIYYHCADIKIVAANGTMDAGTGDAGSVGNRDAGATGGTVDAGGQTGGITGTAGGSSSGTAGGGTTGTTVGGGIPGVAGGSGGAIGATAGGGSSGGTAAGTAGGTTGTGAAAAGGTAVGGIGGAIAGMTPVEGAASDDDGGCECSVSESSPRPGNLIGVSLIALGLLVRRRRLQRR